MRPTGGQFKGGLTGVGSALAAAAGEGIGASSLDDLSAAQLKPILLYHVLGIEVDSTAASAAASNDETITGLGGTIQLGTSGSSIQLDGSALVEVPDVDASNGIIHGISGVILPSITDVVVSDDSFSSLETALTVADGDASNPMLASTLDDDGGTFTVFAPPNAAFTALVSALSGNASTGISALGDFSGYQLIPVLITDLVTTAPEFSSLAAAIVAADGAGGTTPKVAPALDAAAASGAYTLFAPDNAAFTALGTAPTGQALTDVLLYHVLNESTAIYAADALALSSATPFNTLLGNTANEQITISSPSTTVVLDDAGTAEVGAVNGPNYFTSNGVIHKADKVLIPNSN